MMTSDPAGVIAGAAISILKGTVGAAVEHWWDDRRKRAAFHAAVQSAFSRFAQEHANLASTFLDRTFLKEGAAPLLAEFLASRGQLPESRRLVDALKKRYGRDWQIPPAIEAAAKEFLDVLGKELRRKSLLSELLNQRAWDATAENTQGLLRQRNESNRMLKLTLVRDALRMIVQAARGYGAAGATFLREGRDPRDLTAAARDTYADAAIRLRDLGFEGLDKLRDDFDELIARRFNDLVQAAAWAGASDAHLREGVEEFARLAFEVDA